MEALPIILAAGTASTVLRYAAAFFLVIVAIGLVYMLVRAGKALQSVDKLVTDIDTEVVPVINKAGTTVEEVNAELGKVNDITASVAEMTERVDSATRAVETALATPAKKAAAFTSGISQTVSSFFGRHGGSFADAGDTAASAADDGAAGKPGATAAEDGARQAAGGNAAPPHDTWRSDTRPEGSASAPETAPEDAMATSETAPAAESPAEITLEVPAAEAKEDDLP